MNKLQVKYERFELISKTYKLIWQKDGGDPKFIDVYSEDTTLFKDICVKVENEHCNYFVKVLHECVTLMNDITRQQLNENECLWDYLKKEKLLQLLKNMSDLSNLNIWWRWWWWWWWWKWWRRWRWNLYYTCLKSCLIIAFNQVFCHYIFFIITLFCCLPWYWGQIGIKLILFSTFRKCYKLLRSELP